jgi:hypothetical protein
MGMTECRIAEWQDGGMAEWRDGGMAEWWNSGMVFNTYQIYPAIVMVHDNEANNAANDDANNTNGF